MKKFKKNVQQIISQLFGNKKSSELTDEEKAKVAEKYQEVFGIDMLEDYNASKAETDKKLKEYDEALSAIAEAETEEGSAGQSNQSGQSIDLVKGIDELKKKNEELTKKVKDQEETVLKLSKTLEDDNPKIEKMKIGLIGNHTESHLFGVESEFYSRKKRWNQILVNPKVAIVTEPADEDNLNFVKDFAAFGNNMAKLYQTLQKTGQLALVRKNALEIDYADLSNAGLGDQFVIFRQTQLIARIQELPNIYDIFPRRFGIQDRDLMTNAFFDEVSQAWQTGAVWKGGVDLQPEEGFVDDAMFKTLFESMKWLERRYIGYLNKEGSDPMKWSMIEWCILEMAKVLAKEQYERRIVGVYVKPVATEPGHYLHASTGFIYTVIRYINELKLLPFAGVEFSDYDNTATTFVDLVEEFYLKVKEVSPNINEKDYRMFLNTNHKVWFRSQLRAKRAQQNDFTGIDDTKVPDTEMGIIWVPNMGNSKLIVVAKPGNFQMLENLPGEMFAMKFKDDMESVKAWSVWKEGCSADFVGKQFTTLANLAANNYALQEVFCNKPATVLAADDTTADATANFWFVTAANTGATVFTDFTGAVAGKAYILENGSTTNDTTIAKDDKFSEITEAYTPTAVGDYLMVVYDEESEKFFELERRVAGVRTINVEKQPNMPGHGGR